MSSDNQRQTRDEDARLLRRMGYDQERRRRVGGAAAVMAAVWFGRQQRRFPGPPPGTHEPTTSQPAG